MTKSSSKRRKQLKAIKRLDKKLSWNIKLKRRKLTKAKVKKLIKLIKNS